MKSWFSSILLNHKKILVNVDKKQDAVNLINFLNNKNVTKNKCIIKKDNYGAKDLKG